MKKKCIVQKIALLLIIFGFMGGCKMAELKYNWNPYKNMVLNSSNDLHYEFVDLSGRVDAQDLLQKQQYKKIGSIEEDFFNSKEDKHWRQLNQKVKECSGDAYFIYNKNHKGFGLGIGIEVLQYLK